MERDYQSNTSSFVHVDELDWRTAFHEAGHAAAIHIGNQQKHLPPVFFEIRIRKPKSDLDHFSAKVIDGNLVDDLPIAVLESHAILTNDQQHSCQRAFEADIINLLVGPLAEAKYVATRDNEVFNLNLVNLKALHNYGGFSDLEKVQEFLDAFIASREAREKKLNELLTQAYQFIDDWQNWNRILKLARYILESGQENISCDDAISVLDPH